MHSTRSPCHARTRHSLALHRSHRHLYILPEHRLPACASMQCNLVAVTATAQSSSAVPSSRRSTTLADRAVEVHRKNRWFFHQLDSHSSPTSSCRIRRCFLQGFEPFASNPDVKKSGHSELRNSETELLYMLGGFEAWPWSWSFTCMMSKSELSVTRSRRGKPEGPPLLASRARRVTVCEAQVLGSYVRREAQDGSVGPAGHVRRRDP
jgi:hypothetical protein